MRISDWSSDVCSSDLGQPLVHSGNFAFGPAFGFIGKRKASDIGADLPKVGFTVEAGGFAQAYLTPAFRVRAEGRKGLSGHKGWVGEISADYVARSEEHTSELQSLMRISYAVFFLKKQNLNNPKKYNEDIT